MSQTKENEIKIREEIRGNLMICCDSWPLDQLLKLEDWAGALAASGLIYHGQQHVGMKKVGKLLVDEKGNINISDDPSHENNLFRILANCLKEQESIRNAEKPDVSIKNVNYDHISPEARSKSQTKTGWEFL